MEDAVLLVTGDDAQRVGDVGAVEDGLGLTSGGCELCLGVGECPFAAVGTQEVAEGESVTHIRDRWHIAA